MLLSVLFIVGCNSESAVDIDIESSSEKLVTGNSVAELITIEISEPNCVDKPKLEKLDTTKEISLNARNFTFDPDFIVVNYGDVVRLNIRAVGGVQGFALESFGVWERIDPREDAVIEFVADKKGTFEFYNPYAAGRGQDSMIGNLIVK